VGFGLEPPSHNFVGCALGARLGSRDRVVD